MSWTPKGMRQTADPDLMWMPIPSVKDRQGGIERKARRCRGDIILAVVLTVDEVGDHDTEGEEDLEEPGNSAAHILGGTFGNVCRRNRGNATNTHTSDNTTRVDVSKTS